MGFANNVIPGYLVPKIQLSDYYFDLTPADKATMNTITTSDFNCGMAACKLCNDTTPTKETDVTVNLAAQSKSFAKSVDNRKKNKATFSVTASAYSGEKGIAYVNFYVPNAFGEDQYVNLELDEADLKAVQDAVYKARVTLATAKVSSDIKNPSVYPF
jgi:hypothetical protein